MIRCLAICTILALAPSLAASEEQPCKAVGNTVVCDRAAFDVLVSKLLEARKDRDACAVKTESGSADAAALKARLDLANAERDKARADVAVLQSKPKPYGRGFAAVGLGVLSGLGLATAPRIRSSTISTGVLGLSLGSAAAASALILSE